MKTPRKTKTSWEDVSKWYDKSVGTKGHYYHTHIILPGVLKLLKLKKEDSPSLLDLGCGQGVLARHLPSFVTYFGVDVSASLIAQAQKKAGKREEYAIKDLTKPLTLKKKNFVNATIILALQNMADPEQVVKNAAHHLKKGGKLLIVLNHPCFRIPRQSAWGIDEKKRLQYRRVDRYISPLSIPIQMHPGKKASEKTVSFHHPLSYYVKILAKSGFVLTDLEEWCSDKQSSGKCARMENLARKEFPLFLTLVAKRI